MTPIATHAARQPGTWMLRFTPLTTPTMIIPAHMRGPVRITATLPRSLGDRLIDRASLEGRSLSNLVAFLLELAMSNYNSTNSN